MPTISLDNDWHLTLLGGVRLRRAATDLTPRTRKTRALIAILTTSSTPIPRERLISLLWRDRGEEQARGSLRQALYEIRSMGDTDWLVSTAEDIGIERTKLATDLDRLLTLEDADGIAAEIEQCQMPFFGGLDAITPDLDEWLRDQRARVSNAIVCRARQVAGSTLAAGEPAAAARLVNAATRIDPLDEALVRLGFEADAARGHKADLKRRYNRLVSDLREELDVSPSAETEASYRQAATNRPSAHGSSSIPAPAQPRRHAVRWAASLILLLAAAGATLMWQTARWPHPDSAIAVLPFDDMTAGRPSYFGSGVSEEVLNLLAQQRRLRVLGAMTASEIAAAPDRLARARALGIAYLLDGSVRSNGGRVLFIAHLERTSDGAELWSGRYDRRVEDVFAVQREIAASVAGHFAQAIGIAQPATTSAALYDTYLAARALARQRRPSTLADADHMLAGVIAGDPGYAPAYAERAEVLMLRADHPTSYGAIPFAEAREEAEALAKKAVSLDPTSGDGYAALGLLTLSDARSLPYYRRAVALSPQRPEFHRWYGQALLAAHHYRAAISEFEPYNISRPRNVGEVRLKGVEVSGQSFFDFLPGPLAGFGAFGNFTYISSKIGGNDPLSGYPVLGVSKYNFNAGLLYDRYGISSRLVYTYRSKYYDSDATGTNTLRGLNSSAADDQQATVLDYVHAGGRLDFSLGYDISRAIHIDVGGTNLLHNKYKSYYGVAWLPVDYRDDGTTYTMGVRVKI